MSHPPMDQPPTAMRHTDASAAQPDLFQANMQRANEAWHDQLHTAMTGFIGGTPEAKAANHKPPTETHDKKGDATHAAMVSLGLGDMNHSANPHHSKDMKAEEGARVGETQRALAFESVYGRATGKDNHSGMNNTRDGSTLSFNGNPHLQTQGNRQLAFA